MKHLNSLFFFLACIIFVSCGTDSAHDGKPKGTAENPYWEVNQCPRSAPEAVLKTIMLPDHSFSLDPINGTATETASMEGGGKITVIHSGCESYTLTYRIETPNANALDSNIPRKYFEAVITLAAVEPIDDSAIDIRKAQDACMAYAKNKAKEHKFGEALSLGEGEISESMTLDKVEQADGNRIMEITFTSGPL